MGILRSYNVVACLFRRPWLAVPLGLWVMVSVGYYWWLITCIKDLETQNRSFRSQLQTQTAMRIMHIDPTPRYKIPEIPDSPGTICETIHISLVCMGKCGQNITPMLKSLLYHRLNPIHFHLIVDTISQEFFSKLFDTWDLPDVNYTCYNAEDQLSKVSWIPVTHYSGIYTLVKLLIPDILPKTLRNVIVLDSDLTFLSDVGELWELFKNMTSNQLIGLVENESNWYYKPLRWPALGRGYNTGVMLLRLHHIHARTNWTVLWHETVQENTRKLGQTALGDQDVINAIIKMYPDTVYNVSCGYNVQMSITTLSKNCYGEDPKNVKVVHWNSHHKHNISLSDADYFRSRHHTFVNMDGNLLRKKLHICWPSPSTNTTGNNSDLCTSFRAASRARLRTHIYYMEYSYHSEDSFDVTLVLQLSMDRLQFLERLVKYWEGPLSAAIYLADCEVTKLESFIQDWSSTLSSRKNVAYHLVFKHDAVHYPVNYLRNVALAHVTTPYVFLMDVDFVPMEGLYQHLLAALRAINPYPQKKCLVVAAFESQRYRAVPPRNKAQLRARLGSGAGRAAGAAGAGGGARRARDIAPFRAHEWPRGHRATNYTRWINATTPYEVEWEADYEPYLVVHRSVPKYDTRFSGFGWNKVSHIVELRAQGYRAVVLPDAFVLHTTHAPSADITAFRADPHYRICLALLKQEFLEDLSRKHNVSLNEHKRGLEQDRLYLVRAREIR
ncbi:xylosyl- and glucuronyltransferase LARGE2-like [Pectinophora gossypiella]|uniref:xylosyl- and glucuronyltransferase LARGE2-like n=1 Tax=Pectinophora gossypiella TaxID=13191 RepID=UPI00214F0B20|nr:xylosyl- and glucuronyltransferase LARGE2-like [Pectinophora gossypiella]XP_049878653.1 xylosyl- and glucuronyltransferase LARGE2-like [Pectinophora gossypiella]XP_049878654.1 xylosyl- and glucuronyltransferase LARGE2-like [Pectinophora gossypiella]